MTDMPTRLRAVADHLLLCPHLTEPDSFMHQARVMHIHRDPSAVYQWAVTMAFPTVEVHGLGGTAAHLQVTGGVDTHTLVVWCADREGGDLYRWGTGPITMEMLEHYVGTGTTHGR